MLSPYRKDKKPEKKYKQKKLKIQIETIIENDDEMKID